MQKRIDHIRSIFLKTWRQKVSKYILPCCMLQLEYYKLLDPNTSNDVNVLFRKDHIGMTVNF